MSSQSEKFRRSTQSNASQACGAVNHAPQQRRRGNYQPPPTLIDNQGNKRYILKHSVPNKKGQGTEFLVRWLGYSQGFDSRKPIEALMADAPDLLKKFEKDTSLQTRKKHQH